MQILIMNLSSADKLNLFATRKIKILKVLFDYRLCLVQKFPSNPYQFALKLLPTFWGYIIDTEIYTVHIQYHIIVTLHFIFIYSLFFGILCAFYYCFFIKDIICFKNVPHKLLLFAVPI